MLVLNLWWSRRINRTLETTRHFTQRPAVFTELLLYAAVSGAIWGGTVIWLDSYLSDLIFYLCVGVVAIISVVTIAVSVGIRQAYLTQLVFSLGSIDFGLPGLPGMLRRVRSMQGLRFFSLGYQYFLSSLASG